MDSKQHKTLSCLYQKDRKNQDTELNTRHFKQLTNQASSLIHIAEEMRDALHIQQLLCCEDKQCEFQKLACFLYIYTAFPFKQLDVQVFEQQKHKERTWKAKVIYFQSEPATSTRLCSTSLKHSRADMYSECQQPCFLTICKLTQANQNGKGKKPMYVCFLGWRAGTGRQEGRRTENSLIKMLSSEKLNLTTERKTQQ